MGEPIEDSNRKVREIMEKFYRNDPTRLIELPRGPRYFTPALDLPQVATQIPTPGRLDIYDANYPNELFKELNFRNPTPRYPNMTSRGKLFGLYLDRYSNPDLWDFLNDVNDLPQEEVIEQLKGMEVTTAAPYLASPRVLGLFEKAGGGVQYYHLGYYSLPASIYADMFVGSH